MVKWCLGVLGSGSTTWGRVWNGILPWVYHLKRDNERLTEITGILQDQEVVGKCIEVPLKQ